MSDSFRYGDAPFRVQSQLFQPPRTLSASSSLYQLRENTSTRKRLRREGPEDRSHWDPISSGELGSPVPFVNTDYRLAGGVEEMRQLDTDETQESLMEELDYRPNRYRDAMALLEKEDQHGNSYNHTNNNQGSRKRSYNIAAEVTTPQAPQAPHTPQVPSSSWGHTVFNVVGKVLDFCWSGAFRGFSAGGGRTYRMTANSPPSLERSAWQAAPIQDDVFRSDSQSSTIPGRFPIDEDEANYEKTRDRDLQNSWVLVPEEQPSQPSSRSCSPTHVARKVPRRSNAWHPQTRRPTIMPRLNKRPVLNHSQPSAAMAARPATPTKKQFSPTRPSSKDSPASIEAQRYTAKVRRREREEDASIQRLNDQLKAMIREGKEALGSRVEVDDSMDLEDE